MPSDFVHLHVHSHYSLLDGLGRIDDLLDRAKTLGMDSLALTDHGVLYGAIEFYRKAKERGIKPILGCELYVAPRGMLDKTPKVDTAYHHLLVLAKDYTGYKNLVRLTTEAHLTGYYYKPRVDKELLRKFHQGLIATSTCLGAEIPQHIMAGNIDVAERVIREFAEIFGKDNFFLELQDHPEFPEQIKVNKALVDLSKKTNLPLIITADTHYVDPKDKDAHEVLLAVQQNKMVDDADRLTMKEADFSLKPPSQMTQGAKLYSEEAAANTVSLAKMCDLSIPLGKPILPKFQVPGKKSSNTYLRERASEEFKKLFGKGTKDGRERLDFELSTIEKTGFADFILIVSDFVDYAKSQGILTSTRGSAASSLVSYLLGITNIDPLEHQLLFERFLNPARIAPPDIDLDFQDDRRDEVIRYIEKKYGVDHVAQIITFGVMKARLAVRDVTRALNFPYQLGDKIARLIPFGMTLEEAERNVPELRALLSGDADAKRIVTMSKRLEGVVRHASTHAAGIVIGPKPLVEYVPLQHPPQAIGEEGAGLITQYSMYDLEELGLPKIDVLGLANLTVLKNALRIVKKVYGKELTCEAIPLDDSKAYKLFAKGETIGLFQFESSGMRRYLQDLKPTELKDLVAMVALFRPGPMELIPSFIRRKFGKEKITYLHEKLEPILRDTYGIAVYQEQVLRIARDIAGFSFGEADILRKAIGKKIKKLLLNQREKFVGGAVKNGVSKEIAAKLFDFTEPFARYGFNKAHATVYALIAYWTGYLKTYYPGAFFAALLTSDFGNHDRIAIEISESKRLGIDVLPPDINESFVEFAVISGKAKDPDAIATAKAAGLKSGEETEYIRFGLSGIKNVGVGVAAGIQEERRANGPYKDLPDFLKRLGGRFLNRKVLESLIKAGALDRFGERNQLLAGLDELTRVIGGASVKATADQMGLFASTSDSRLSTAVRLPDVDPATKEQRLSWEKELLGIYLSDHPLKGMEEELLKVGKRLSDLSPEEVGQKVRVAGIVSKLNRIIAKNGAQMGFAVLEDTTARREIIVFPKTFERYGHLLTEGTIIVVDGTVNAKARERTTTEDMEEVAEEEIKVLADKIYEFGKQEQIHDVLEEVSLPKSLIINLPKSGAKDLLERIREVLLAHPGNSEVVLRLPTDGGFKEHRAKTTVEVTDHLVQSLTRIIGPDRVRAI
jgi:DNA polymerase-3 subunit alpha